MSRKPLNAGKDKKVHLQLHIFTPAEAEFWAQKFKIPTATMFKMLATLK